MMGSRSTGEVISSAACMMMAVAVAFAGALMTPVSVRAQDQAGGAAEPAATAAPVAVPFDFEGSRWHVVGVNGKIVAMAGDLHFEADRVDGASACNFFGGGFETGTGETLRIDVTRMTRRGCSGEALELERAYLEALKSVRRYGFSDDAHEKLVFLDEAGANIAELERKHAFHIEGTPLKVVSYLYQDGLYSVKPGSKVTIRFAGGRMEGDTGCSLFSGNYEIAGDTIKITLDMAVPRSEKCAESLQRQDQAVIANLEAAARFDVGRNVIRLLQADRDWAVLWLAQDMNPVEPAGEPKAVEAASDPAVNAAKDKTENGAAPDTGTATPAAGGGAASTDMPSNDKP